MPIVGIGASAGGVDALRDFFQQLPADAEDTDEGMAFVVVLHLSPDYESNLVDILQEETPLSVVRAEDGAQVMGGTVYVIPPASELTIENGCLRVKENPGVHDVTSVDRFLRSLASDQGDNAVGIVLSGSGTDGTLGLRAIKEVGGIVMAQSPDEAGYESMPESAISTGLMDLVRPVGELAEMLVTYRNRTGIIQLPETETALEDDERSTLTKIFSTLYNVTGLDFSNYKRSTVLRRLERRLQLCGVRTLGAYLERLQTEPDEVQALRKDLLISVTSFFRDPEAFEALAETVIPALFEDKSAADQVRVWVPGTATGEEAYSLAMLLVEYAETLEHPPDLQIFATDVDQEALAFARQGRYPKAIKTDLSDERLRRFFQSDGDFYQINHGLREHVLFADHNMLEDPPFSSLDLVSCRNLLIYLDQQLQEHAYKLMHYGLRDGGYLFLGRSEALGTANHFFSTVDASNNILQAHATGKQPRLPITSTPLKGEPSNKRSQVPFSSRRGAPDQWETESTDVAERVHHRALIEAVPSVLVNENREIVHLSGTADRYLQFEEGTPTSDVLLCVPEILRPELRSALYQAFNKEEVARRTDLRIQVDGQPRSVSFQVRPLSEDGSQYAHIRFEEDDVGEEAEPAEESPKEVQLREELERTREQLQNTSEEYEAVTEEMETSNEELLSMNEELQSKNEELETSKEELQSVNEELKATNRELKSKVEEVRQSKAALENLMEATEVATLFLDPDLIIQRFTPPVKKLLNVREADVGRPLSDVTQQIKGEDLDAEARSVLRSGEPVEREVRSRDDRWYYAKIHPYRTVDGAVDGIVLTFVDITERRRLEQKLVNATERVRRRIGQDLHDILSSDLAALAMKMDNYKNRLKDVDGVDVAPLVGLVEDARTAAEQARTLSHALVPVALQEEHLAAALQNLCREQAEVDEIEFVFEGDREEPFPINKETATHMYRIAHEAVVNVRRHAEASGVWVRLYRTNDTLVMTVRDDGVGLTEPVSEAAGLGLRTMQYRANLIGASISFETGENGGTVVRCTLSLAEAGVE
jgi:two-component system CheB/CheR fusion protein